MGKIPEGFCQCGCGRHTNIAKETNHGYQKGQPYRYCDNHWQRTRGGDPKERFWSKVDIRNENECWEWIPSKGTKEYGNFSLDKKVRQKASRVAYILTHGPLPRNIHVCHTCDNPPCCNPAHLFTGTQADNMKDMKSKGRASHATKAFGESHGNAVYTEEQILKARELRCNGYSYREIMDLVGIHNKGGLSDIIHYRTWKHLP